MTKKPLIIITVLLGLLVSLPASAQNSDDNIKKAVGDLKNSYREDGMSIQLGAVNDCYRKALRNKDKIKFEYCAAYDLSAFFIDNQMAKQVNCPPFEGFELEAVSKRMEAGLTKLGYSKEQRKTKAKLIADTAAKWFNVVFEKD